MTVLLGAKVRLEALVLKRFPQPVLVHPTGVLPEAESGPSSLAPAAFGNQHFFTHSQTQQPMHQCDMFAFSRLLELLPRRTHQKAKFIA